MFWVLPDVSFVKRKRRLWSTFSTVAHTPPSYGFPFPTFSNKQIGSKGVSLIP